MSLSRSSELPRNKRGYPLGLQTKIPLRSRRGGSQPRSSKNRPHISRPSIRSIVDVFHAEGFSTMRRFDSTFDTTDPHEAFKPPVDDAAADAPAEPGTEREGAAPDEASSGP